jgi:class 3 adenylate cyclase
MMQSVNVFILIKRLPKKLEPLIGLVKAGCSCGYFFIFSLVMFAPFNSFSKNTEIDSLKNLIQDAPDDSLKVELLNKVSYALFTSDYEQSIVFGIKSKELADKINYPTGQAYALKNIGLGYYMKGDFVKVFDYWNQSLAIFQSMNDLLGEANIQNNLGAIYYNRGDDAKAIDYYLKSLTNSEKLKDTLRIATALINIGGIYYNKEATQNKALEYYLKAAPLGDVIKDNGVIGTISLNIGDLYLKQGKDSLALFYLEKSRNAWKGTGRVSNSISKIGSVYANRGEFAKAEIYQIDAIEIARKFDAKLELTRCLLSLANTYKMQAKNKLALEIFSQAKVTASELKSNYELKDAYQGIATSYANLSDYLNAYKYQSLLLQIKDTLFNSETDDKIKGLQFTYEIDKKQGEIDLLTKDKELQKLMIQKQRIAKNAFLAGLIFILIITFIIFRNYRNKVKINKILDKQNEEIENLLLNILPKKIARELRENGIAKPRNYDSVSVIFTDFKDFSKISATLTPEELIDELNDYFMAFDDITQKYNLEKIKTIGDAYMCAGGLPSRNETHPFDAVMAALEMQKYMQQKNIFREAKNEDHWGLRVGIHTGPIMAGVVGKKKYAYDIWGNTVNIASRMESTGEVGKVNISADTYELIKDKFKCHHRGKVTAKNVGEIDMYFIEHEIETGQFDQIIKYQN